ncbi:FG-GAP-like repeat-containing protein [Streptomyces sp. G5(2025)]|uniref:FG-GAP-like repeat-containing protein n=1 Tax=Streptomyces sp. G5(2025) TaxID=3406628 RepID=UPI003C156922
MGHLSSRKRREKARTTHAYRPLSPKRRAWLTIGAVVLGGAGAVTYAAAGPNAGDEPGADPYAKRPASVHDLALKADGAARELPRTSTGQFSLLGVSWSGATRELAGTAQVRTRALGSGKWSGWRALKPEAGARAASEPLWVGPSDGVEVRVAAADGPARRELPKDLEVSLVDPGVTSQEAKSPALGPARGGGTRTGAGAATAPDDTVPPTPPDDDTVPPTPPDETGPAPTDSGEPTGTPSSPTAPPSASGEPTIPSGSPTGPPTGSPSSTPEPTPTKPTPPPSTVNRPPIIGRAAWGADESLVKDPAEYGAKVAAVFVHHTAGTNDYRCAESPALIRALMTYQVRTEGMNDLGHNFLVDKCGRVFEGRAGGVDVPVRGEHTDGFDGESTGIAVLGDFEGDPATGRSAGRPTRAALESVARVAAWKLGQYDGDPAGEVTLTATADTGVWKKGERASLHTVSGHRDAATTTCPGKNLYAGLDDVRRFAAGAGRSSAAPTADFNRDGATDLVAGTPKASGDRGRVTVVPGGPGGPVGGRKISLTQTSAGVPGASEAGDAWGSATAWGDLNGDGYADLVIGAPGEDDSSGHTDRGAVTMLYGPAFTSGTDMRLSDDFNYTKARFGSAVAVGDFNADGEADVFAAATGTGGSWAARLGPDRESGGSLTPGDTAIAYADAASGDFNRDGYADVALAYRDQAGKGKVAWFRGGRSGLNRVGVLSVPGGRSVAVGDVNGNGYDDLVIGQPYTAESGAHAGGQVTVVPGTPTGPSAAGTKTVHQATSGVVGAAEAGDAMGWSVAAGDYDLDGYADVATGAPGEDITRAGANRKDAGTSLLLRGSASGLTGTGALAVSQDEPDVPGATESGDRLGSSVTLADLSGSGRADLAIGAEGEDAGDGTILQLDSGSAGVPDASGVSYGRTLLGTPAGARLGQALTP